MVRFHEMLLLAAECPKPLGKREISDMNEDLVNHSKDQLHYLTHWLDISQNSQKDKPRIHQFWKENFHKKLLLVLPYSRVRIWEEDIPITEVEEFGNLASWKYFQKTEMRRKFWEPKEMKNLYFLQQMVHQKYQEETTKFQEPLWDAESVVRRENISGESQGDREEFQPEESKRWRKNQQGFLGSRRSSERISLVVNILNREVQLHVPRKDHILFDWLFFFLMSPGQLMQI